MKLSILDQSPIPKGQTARDALQQSIKLVRLAEELGYHRYWVAEHHNMNGIASSSPEVLIARLAAESKRIRIGSGGVLLPHYSPYKVAENFHLLSNLAPRQIDLGIGRAPGGERISTLALNEGRRKSLDRFPDQVKDLQGYLTQNLPEDHPYQGVKAAPLPPEPPEMWLLGSSDGSAGYAADLGTAFSFAHFINPNGGPSVARMYRDRFQPSALYEEPRVNVCIFAVCADTDEEAERHASTLELWMLQIEQGKTGGIPTLEEAEAFDPTPWERFRMKENRRRIIVGNPNKVKEQILELAASYRTDEVMLITNIFDQEARLRSYQRIAEAFDLSSDA
ncbi:LLM class flavin-dependent oxidoreductase [Paludifilum halophilum]|uniref:LLM class flavin-dependent oxidoreductase n=1 Tax=Paludifilum halophilum TaxID=1642702 RepID=A0A235B9N4_9BACL|nr:LLM class flavin-dependent oxidoreductase [Paludifilum halophilum]OYD08976.1 LLM class flavin-dependent oxidoreductase [Paludifilum halophilum]